MKLLAERRMIPVLVKVETPDGPRWEWRQAEGVEVKFPADAVLKNGDELTIEGVV